MAAALVFGSGRVSAAPLHPAVAGRLAAGPGLGCASLGKHHGGSNNGFLPDDGTGNPVSDDKLDIGWSTGGGLTGGADIGRGVMAHVTDWTFQIDRIIAHFAIAQIYAAMQFCYVRDGALPSTATHIADTFQTQIVSPLGLLVFFVALMLLFCAYHAMKGRTARGVSELFVSIVILTVSLAAWAAPATLLLGDNGLAAQGRDAATTVGGIIATGHPPPDPKNPSADTYQSLLQGMEKAFIFEPHALLNWGQTFGPDQPCGQAGLDAYNHIVSTGPHGADDGPRDEMVAAGCTAAKDWNYTPNGTRMAYTGVIFVGSLFLMVMAGVMAIGLMLCQFTFLSAIISSPFVFAAAVLPGPGRRWMGKWVTAVIGAFLGQIVAVAVLSIVMVAVNGIASSNSGGPILNTLALMDAAILYGILKWFKWRHASKKEARSLATKVAQTQFGGDEGGRGGVAQGAARGLAPRNSATGLAIAAVTGAGAGSLAERSARYVRQRGRRGASRRRRGTP